MGISTFFMLRRDRVCTRRACAGCLAYGRQLVKQIKNFFQDIGIPVMILLGGSIVTALLSWVLLLLLVLHGLKLSVRTRSI